MSAPTPTRSKKPASPPSVRCRTTAFILIIITPQPTHWTRSFRVNCRRTPRSLQLRLMLLLTPNSRCRGKSEYRQVEDSRGFLLVFSKTADSIRLTYGNASVAAADAANELVRTKLE